MSGVEIAGIALAVLPLFISALEDYEKGLDPLKAFMRWERELPKFIRKLRNQHVHFSQTMRLLLEPITTEIELAEMLSDPSGQHWKDGEMSKKLEDRLQESYTAYQNTIEEIERIMKQIAAKLDLERAAELKRNDLEAILAANPQKNNKFEFKKRVRFGMNKKNIKKLLEDLDECNKELERFTDRSEKLETHRKAAKPSFAKHLQRVQTYAKDLHNSILSSWSCSCQSYHRTSLQLEPRDTIFATGMKKAKASTATSFAITFSSSGEFTHPWTWQEAEIRIDDEDDDTQLAPKISNVKRSVSFGDNPPPPYSAMPDPAMGPMPTLQEVKDMCASIQQLHKSAPCIGFSIDSKGRLKGVYPVECPVEKKRPGSNEVVSLEELLDTPPVVNGRPAKLSKKERYSLAVTLASSALQLNSTPWFPDQWGAKDILFHRTSVGPRMIDVEHPHVRAKLLELTKDASTTPKPRGFHNKNTVLLALAVALLELYFGMSVEKHQQIEAGATDAPVSANPWSLCAMAYEWTESEQENLSAAFLTAVTHCLRCFSDPGASLQDSEFLQAAVEGIVLPLQDELYQFLGKTTT
ncbi:hypothetical protein P154DRAFT_571101 [Amniculicola lignicola CBS 123094]|uniref:DUF7580 domain-containing protein n=1 Tax=Amniculicola lignicola CBS 123094 TaxID=1392246 RepID=A0A6A5WXA5_9PLEO|nr:hypothetical protein P154DRAFT_571101 [Amniculicola lignicola CBS 123094]